MGAVNFDAGSIAFAAKMAKRTAPGPFATAPIVQGPWSLEGNPLGDELSFSSGSQISGGFYANWDSIQGSISCWVTPEWDGAEGLVFHYILWESSGNLWLRFYNSTLGLYIKTGVLYVDTSAWVAGTTYHVVVRWDRNNTLDGTNHACISINGSHTFGCSTVNSTGNVGSPIRFGCAISGVDCVCAANALIQGLTIYRRPLFDDTYGVDVGNGDEIALIYASGSGENPADVTGEDDVVFALPTDSSTGQLSTGTGEAHSYPHSSNVLTDGFCQTTYASSGWSTEDSPSDGPKDTATGNKIFTWAYEWTCDAADEGINQTISSLTPGTDYLLRVFAHSSDANDVRLLVYDNDNAANIVSYDFGGGSSRTVPGIAEIGFELPALCTEIIVKVMGTANGQTVYFHGAILLTNLWDDPSFETGTAPTNVGTPTTSAQSAEQAHSATNSWKVVADAADEGIKRAITTTSGKFYHCAAWVYALTSGTVDMEEPTSQDGGAARATTTTNDAWERLVFVFRATAASTDVQFTSNGSQTFYVDDVMVRELDDVSLTVIPASAANSAETSGLRVDGRDTCTQ